MMKIIQLQRMTANYLIPYLYIHIPLIWLSSFLTGNPVSGILVFSVILCVIPTILFKVTGVSALTRYVSTVSFMLLIAALVFAFRGHPWQIDIHMYFFAGLAMLLGYADWRVYILATAVVAVHHLVLNFTIPFWVFPEGADFFRVVLHAVIVIVETAVLTMGTLQLVNSLCSAEKATVEAVEAQNQAKLAIEEQMVQEKKLQEEKAQALSMLANDVEMQIGEIASNLSNASQNLSDVSSGMNETADQMRIDSQNASDATHNISSNVDAVAASSEELSASVQEISKQVQNSSTEANNAAALSQSAMDNVASLSAKVNEISEFVTLITDIANQTNLLALNATIEAARAGEAGKGFAVVAGEVKNLASQTAKATEQIELQINSVIGATDETVKGIQSINNAIQTVQETSNAIAAAIEEQGAATQEIAGNAVQTAQTVSHVAATISNVNTATTENRERLDNLTNVSQNLQNEAAHLQSQLSLILSKLRDQSAA